LRGFDPQCNRLRLILVAMPPPLAHTRQSRQANCH
jgi:hypothetical protein